MVQARVLKDLVFLSLMESQVQFPSLSREPKRMVQKALPREQERDQLELSLSQLVELSRSFRKLLRVLSQRLKELIVSKTTEGIGNRELSTRKSAFLLSTMLCIQPLIMSSERSKRRRIALLQVSMMISLEHTSLAIQPLATKLLTRKS